MCQIHQENIKKGQGPPPPNCFVSAALYSLCGDPSPSPVPTKSIIIPSRRPRRVLGNRRRGLQNDYALFLWASWLALARFCWRKALPQACGPSKLGPITVSNPGRRGRLESDAIHSRGRATTWHKDVKSEGERHEFHAFKSCCWEATAERGSGHGCQIPYLFVRSVLCWNFPSLIDISLIMNSVTWEACLAGEYILNTWSPIQFS